MRKETHWGLLSFLNDHSESAQVFRNWAAQEKFWVHSVVLNVTFPVRNSSEKSVMSIKWLNVVNIRTSSVPPLLVVYPLNGPIFWRYLFNFYREHLIVLKMILLKALLLPVFIMPLCLWLVAILSTLSGIIKILYDFYDQITKASLREN